MDWGRCEREKVMAVRLMSNEEDEMENRAENALQRIAALRLCPHCGGEGHVKYGDPCQPCCGRGRVPRLSQEQMASVATRALTMDGGGS